MINNVRKFGTYYMLFHIPTNLYYVPFNFKSYCNLAKFGKMYPKFPNILRENPNSFYYDHKNEKKPILLNEWEIHEVVIGIIKKTNYKNDADRRHIDKISKFASKGL